MENIIKEVMRAMKHGTRRDEAINDAANIHAASYDAYCALYNALDEETNMFIPKLNTYENLPEEVWNFIVYTDEITCFENCAYIEHICAENGMAVNATPMKVR